MIAYLDCSTGVSGDKLLGALIDAGFDVERLRSALAAIGLPGVHVSVERRLSHGIMGVGVSVEEPGAPRRHWHELKTLLDSAALPADVRERTLAALGALAGAEARVHGVPVDEVHFHEIGGADTIADVLGVALALHDLAITALSSTPVAVGAGTVATEHGTLPVPAPATALLLEGAVIAPGSDASPHDDPIGELTTPTGAALLRTISAGTGPVPPMTLRRVGTGCGTRDIGVPNICRLLIGDAVHAADGISTDEAVQLETNLDHLTPEELAIAAARLRDAGALDVWLTPVVMKKGRPATVLSLLVRTGDAAGLAERVIAETGTLGVRVLPVTRTLAERDTAEIETSLGSVRFKIARLPDGTRALRAESDDVGRLAAEHGRAADAVARIVEDDAARATGVQPMRQRPSSADTSPSD